MALRFLRTNIDRLLRELDATAQGAEKARTRALNAALRTMRTSARRRVQDTLNLKAKDINAVLSIRRARRSTPDVVLQVQAKAVGLIQYGARQRRAGVSVQVKRKGARKVIRGAFIATMRSGHRGVFERENLGERRAARLPIEELFSTSVLDFMDTPENVRRIQEAGERKFREEYTRLLQLDRSR